ncbi:MAG: class I SAM-dependent methyltransferase [Polyangia bacterium]
MSAPSTVPAHRAVYDDARTYAVAFSYRDVESELAFLLRVGERYGGRPVASLLELACGPAFHAVAAAQRGLRATALDLSEAMVRLVQQRAASHGVTVEALAANMADFVLPAPVDLAFNLMTSISYLISTAELHAHFASVARALRPGGVYVIENNHPNDFWTRSHFQPSSWTQSDGELEVRMSWISEPPEIDVVNQTYTITTRTEIGPARRDGVVPADGPRRELTDRAVLRMIWPQELKALAEAHGFSLAAFFGELSESMPIDAPEAWRTVAVLVRDR